MKSSDKSRVSLLWFGLYRWKKRGGVGQPVLDKVPLVPVTLSRYIMLFITHFPFFLNWGQNLDILSVTFFEKKFR
jgi:hypothetical protein